MAPETSTAQLADGLRLSYAELVALPGVGHAPHCEDPGRAAAVVAAFVERLSASSG